MAHASLNYFYKDTRLVTVSTADAAESIGRAGDLSFCQMNPQTGSVKLLETDAQGSCIGLAKTSGHLVDIAYSPYGNDNYANDTALYTRFVGEALLPLARGYSLGMGHRVFYPSLMRFARPDALSPFNRGGLNTYAYCLGDPVNRSDPSGRWSVSKWYKGGYSYTAIRATVVASRPGAALSPRMVKSFSDSLQKRIYRSEQKMSHVQAKINSLGIDSQAAVPWLKKEKKYGEQLEGWASERSLLDQFKKAEGDHFYRLVDPTAGDEALARELQAEFNLGHVEPNPGGVQAVENSSSLSRASSTWSLSSIQRSQLEVIRTKATDIRIEL